MDISFEDLGLDEQTLAAVEAKGFENPTPIQILAIPRLLNGDSNLIAKARTGTGKTAAFGLPLVQNIREQKAFPQALVLTPTRELALQVCKEIESLTGKNPLRFAAIYGGQSMREQLRALKQGVEIVVGTPGRIKDHLDRGSLKLEKISYFILDEADEMLDMGFIEDIEEIFSKANSESRKLLFSATMPSPILKIAAAFMGDYEIVEEEADPEEGLLTEQKYWFVREGEKLEALTRLIDISPDFYGLVFTQTKADADIVCRQLDERGYEAAALHGDIPQNQREKILSRFRSKKTRILVATDVAARGIDIEGLSHVVNYALPFDSPTYVHRIGRTGRAGAKGLAFTLVRPEERRKLDFLKQAVRKAIKDDMQEAPIPTVEEILSVKRRRLTAEISEMLADGNKAVSESFGRMAEELCELGDAKAVLTSVLALGLGRELDAARYGEITVCKVPAQTAKGRRIGETRIAASGFSSSQGGQLRLYVGLGRRDGFNARQIADYLSGLLNIPQRLVDRIDVSSAFSLVSLPVQAGQDAVERSRRDKTLPHIHVDTKEGFNSGFSGRQKQGERGTSSFSRSKTGNASLYKKSPAKTARAAY